MNKRWIKLLILFLGVSLVLVACAPEVTPPAEEVDDPPAVEEVEETVVEEPEVDEEMPAEEKQPIRIGLHAPLTGPIAFLGQGFDMGIQLAIEELGGEIDGHPIEYVVADNQCNPTDAVTAVQKLIDEDQVDAMIGGGCSSATVAALPVIYEGQVPNVSATSTTPSIFDVIGIGGNPWAFRINPDDLIMAQGFTEEIMARTNPQKISLVAENTDFGRGAISSYKPIFENLGVEIATEDYFDLGTGDFRPALTSMRGAGSDAVFIVMTENDCTNFMRQFREVNVEADIYSRASCISPLALDMTEDDPDVLNGIVEFVFFQGHQDPDLAARFLERWDTPLTGHRMGGYYAMYHTIAPAIRYLVENDIPIDRASIRDAIEMLNVETPAGMINFDDHNQAYTNGVLLTAVMQPDGTLATEVLTFVDLGPVDRGGN